MSVFAYAENTSGLYKKSALEAVSYAKTIADKMGKEVVAITINSTESPETLYRYGASKVINIKSEGLKTFNPKNYAQLLSQTIEGEIVVLPNTADVSAFAPILSVEKGYSLITNALEEPKSVDPFEVKKKVFSGKGFMMARAEANGVVVTLSPNAFEVRENAVQGTEQIVEISVENNAYQVISTEQKIGKIDLKEAEIVVSGGRGIKEITDWTLVEQLAETLGGAVACSKPVSDNGWRPHSEHVGQTGKTISPNLYIAVGISGAIQHLAGVNGSKTIVVINTDADAPFFKSADYGVVGDAVQVLPLLNEKIKALKS